MIENDDLREDIETMITRRILAYHRKLIADGFIPDLPRSPVVVVEQREDTETTDASF